MVPFDLSTTACSRRIAMPYFLDPLKPAARPMISASRHMNATRIMTNSVRRLRPKYRLCGGSTRSRRSEIAHRVAPAPAPRRLRFLLWPSSGTSQLESTLLAVSTPFKCAGGGAPTSLRGIWCALMVACCVLCVVTRRNKRRCTGMGISEYGIALDFYRTKGVAA